MNKIILFDLDGTLIDSTDAIVSTFRFAFKEQGFDFRGSDKNIKDLIGYPLDIMFERLGVSKQKVWDYVDSYKNRYRVISVEQTTLLENAFEAVQLASKIARVSVVTTKTRMYTIPILDNFNITQHFEVITGRENVENPKPHPEPILKTLAQMNYDKNSDDVWMIGDTKLDLICANEAKVNAIGVLCGYSDEEELLKYTNIVKKDALEAIKYISTL
ncbi:HAD family hydrolase [Aliarcobacter butzleri]|uniref:HAD family hydrolase n=1 Tax=Aliarcobacter butzleri TaxID=28197 RepID=UPI001261140B|nr:HAD family hydrolase [Aliarcobacter butzleri]MCT7581061.1 HAD family hydrolase [Aliarcobacter butzleri]MDN5078024.1 HAD family hydrolase [Aliarcobacter butzleri]MDN5095106.1 HAD family hydrolase [Aliarcobacter butzleri]MDN5119321.1 HAD family hydrolase [Aliarcobacter butzleri]MDN5125357.1 HAD family hydrolase [Aliarcobacter butzleri]